MAISSVYVTMKCDNEDCQTAGGKMENLNMRDVIHYNIDHIRIEANLQGWTYVDGKDLCPDCSGS